MSAGAIGFWPLTVYLPVRHPFSMHCSTNCASLFFLLFHSLSGALKRCLPHAVICVVLDALRCALQVQMHIKQKHIPRFSVKWCALQLLNVICFCVSLVAAIGSIEGMIVDTQGFAPFQTTA